MAGQFALDLSRLVKKAKGQTETVVRKVMLEAFQRVVLKSPVDTGRFRGNWIVGLGSYSTSTTDATDPGGAATIRRITSDVMGARIDGRPIYLTNSLPYAHRLEYGYSAQAPSGMVRLTLTEISSKYGA